MSDKKLALTPEQQIRILTGRVQDMQGQIDHMLRCGGYVDSKTLSMRCTRIEERLERLEPDGEMVKDVLAHQQTLLEEHLKDRHDADMVRDNDPDVVAWRKIRRRMRDWAEKTGLMKQRDASRSARLSENRLRPMPQHA